MVKLFKLQMYRVIMLVLPDPTIQTEQNKENWDLTITFFLKIEKKIVRDGVACKGAIANFLLEMLNKMNGIDVRPLLCVAKLLYC